jgi:hypothetical protein
VPLSLLCFTFHRDTSWLVWLVHRPNLTRGILFMLSLAFSYGAISATICWALNT